MKIKMEHQFKIYNQINEPVATKLSDSFIGKIGANGMSLPELVGCFRSFYKESYPVLFEMVVKQVWLEQKVTFNNVRRYKRNGNGFSVEKAFSFFMTGMVGVGQKALTNNQILFSVVSYFKDFFPNFSDHNPFEEPEYYKYPYEYITPDFLYVVRDHDHRLEMLKYAEEKKMTIREFVEWAVNQITCENLDFGEEVYSIARNRSYFIYIKKNKKWKTKK